MAKFTQKQDRILSDIIGRTASVKPFRNDTPQSKQQRIKKATASGWVAFSFFSKTYFPHIVELDFSEAHQEAFELIEKNNYGITGLTGFRGMGKTVLFGIVYTIWKLAKKSKYVIHTAADEDLALERTRFIFNELQNNSRLKNDFSQLLIVEGEAKSFYTKSKAKITAKSIKQQHRGTVNPLTGKRPDLIICDDIDKEDNQGNRSIGKMKLERILSAIFGALDPKKKIGRVIWLGNLAHPNYSICQYEKKLIEEIKSEEPNSRPEQRQHLVTGKKQLLRFPIEKADGSSRWEIQYPTEELPVIKKTMGATAYLREMMGRPVIDGNIFKPDWFKRWSTLPKKFKQVWLYADPARGSKGCYKAIGAIGYDGYKYYLIKLWGRQTTNTSFFRYFYDAFVELKNKYGVRFKAGMEANYKQDDILIFFDTWCSENGYPRISHHIKRIYNYDNKLESIESLETIIETGGILFPEGQDTPTAIEQFSTYPDGYIDIPDMIARCMRRFNTFGKKKRTRIKRLSY